jgi:hypothetical protein
MRPRRVIALLATLSVLAVGGYVAVPYARAVSLIIRAANMGGADGAKARSVADAPGGHRRSACGADATWRRARAVLHAREFSRTVLLIPGIHSAGIEEPRLRAWRENWRRPA